jgi:hypothetical protein
MKLQVFPKTKPYQHHSPPTPTPYINVTSEYKNTKTLDVRRIRACNRWSYGVIERERKERKSAEKAQNGTFRLFDAGRHAREKVHRSHVGFMIVSVLVRHLNRGEIAENFVGRRVLADSILILNNLNEWEIRDKVRGLRLVGGSSGDAKLLATFGLWGVESFYVWNKAQMKTKRGGRLVGGYLVAQVRGLA